jgi:hypothetical protein
MKSYTYIQLISRLKRGGVRHRTGSGDHYVFYPEGWAGVLVVPYLQRTASKSMLAACEKALNGTVGAKQGR